MGAANRVASVQKYFRNVRAELRKVTWPSRNELITSTIIVLATVVGIGTILWVSDAVFSQLLRLIL